MKYVICLFVVCLMGCVETRFCIETDGGREVCLTEQEKQKESQRPINDESGAVQWNES